MTYKPYRLIKSTGIEFQYVNGSGSSLAKPTPVRIKADGTLDYIDVSIEAHVFALAGVVSSSSVNGQKSGVVTAGRVENIATSFSFGDPVYISKAGNLTNVKPSNGVGGFVHGDFIVRIGTISKNETNPSQKDLVLELNLVGQL